MKGPITINGIPVNVVSDEEAENAAFVVCCDARFPSPFTDNVAATCALCLKAIIHRPHAPKKPPKLCIDCAMRFSEEKH